MWSSGLHAWADAVAFFSTGTWCSCLADCVASDAACRLACSPALAACADRASEAPELTQALHSEAGQHNEHPFSETGCVQVVRCKFERHPKILQMSVSEMLSATLTDMDVSQKGESCRHLALSLLTLPSVAAEVSCLLTNLLQTSAQTVQALPSHRPDDHGLKHWFRMGISMASPDDGRALCVLAFSASTTRCTVVEQSYLPISMA